jgi:hypothetical protein
MCTIESIKKIGKKEIYNNICYNLIVKIVN